MATQHILSVDVEAFSDKVDRAEWDRYPSRVEANAQRLLDRDVDEKSFLTIAIGIWDSVDDPISRLEKVRSIPKKGGRFFFACTRSGALRASIPKPRFAKVGLSLLLLLEGRGLS